ncbi:putative Transcriptional regulator, AraC family [Vibrio nigripulchritudo MADA3029]|uniref:Transcriptional regulator, AraC family n=2 Tax=Vibrio nigripulchritudo TaxID=28173 RepID=A0AAV2VSM3_9VIBR|nr:MULTISPECIES: AraC family transcriptional regulator [Vibrio]EGU55723.1 transcriptional regulator, AraC family protein [Vibrio nigripulchritudo ATCC 27043]KJY78640.1 AraC family transcriptional regulator [Vibrio nigripulchritudo]UAB73085.1 helix-turn-helix domain-containing protein [Vibrio sp. SCSIO 43132]CCN35463.1 putative Transcriptional regulator, AraC family [Vibrio nigripulchritudo AM115]CCN39350.1 putative Transcriptional regulator, AraC family [Vibrio nigripulchritudo FTn2]
MRPFVEAISDKTQFNWKIQDYVCDVPKSGFTCAWHYHVEYELVLYIDPGQSFNGNYFAGDHIGNVDHNTLLLYGPGLPHMISGRSKADATRAHTTLILWFTQSWIDKLIEAAPELTHLKPMLRRSYKGLEFSSQTGAAVHNILKGYKTQSAHQQLFSVLEALTVLAEDEQAKTLASSSYAIERMKEPDESFNRVEAARRYIESHYDKPIKIHDFCQSLHMSESSAYRLFEKHFKESFSEHLKKFRIGKACELLVNTEIPVSLVAERSGFNNMSNFNRQFKSSKNMTPSDFRSQFNRS